MNISIVGSGYVGTTIAACLAELGHSVTNVDIDTDVVDAINEGTPPIYEPGLDELVATHAGDRLAATTDYGAVRDTDVTFLALPTPSNDDGSIDTSYVEAGAEQVGEELATKDGSHVIVTKSTVVPGTTEEVIEPQVVAASGKSPDEELHVAVNPEFLREGSAVSDFLDPDKVVFGARTQTARETVKSVFEPLVERTDTPIVETGLREAEMIKYANNAFLAAKVSLINEIGNICKAYDVDAYEVADAIGLDDRIGSRFLGSGVG